jgi:hypothetical protein
MIDVSISRLAEPMPEMLADRSGSRPWGMEECDEVFSLSELARLCPHLRPARGDAGLPLEEGDGSHTEISLALCCMAMLVHDGGKFGGSWGTAGTHAYFFHKHNPPLS